MKKLFGMIAIVLLFSSVVFGETTKLSETIIKTDHKDWHWFKTGVICVDGYKFVVVTTVTDVFGFLSFLGLASFFLF